MGYIFFKNEFPTSEDTAKHFQEIFNIYSNRPDLAEQFHSQVLKPFGKAMSDYRYNTDYFPWNPFIGGIFTKINNISIWNTLIETRHMPHRRMLLAVLLIWGFASHDEYEWTYEDENKLFIEFENSEILKKALAYSHIYP
jgi:hypothetical protein